jgi:hypothetical protein
MRFCDWIPLSESTATVPEEPGLFQVRLAHGLISYPGGKSAMFYYGYAADLRQGIEVFRDKILPRLGRSEAELLVRWLVTKETERKIRSLLGQFVTKFESLPQGNAVQLRHDDEAAG